MPAMDLGQFLDRLERSNLLTRDDLDALHAEIDLVRDVVQVEPLGRKLVRRGQLTGWQVQRLLSGRDDFQLGSYRLLDLLGRGGMGTVFKAEHVVLGRVVAIKVMASQLVKNAKHVARFQQEIQAAAAIDRAREAITLEVEHELLAIDVREALDALGRIVLVEIPGPESDFGVWVWASMPLGTVGHRR